MAHRKVKRPRPTTPNKALPMAEINSRLTVVLNKLNTVAASLFDDRFHVDIDYFKVFRSSRYMFGARLINRDGDHVYPGFSGGTVELVLTRLLVHLEHKLSEMAETVGA